MNPSIQMLEIAIGIKDSLIGAGFTFDSLLHASPAEIAAILGIEIYVAKLIRDAARKAAGGDIESENKMMQQVPEY